MKAHAEVEEKYGPRPAKDVSGRTTLGQFCARLSAMDMDERHEYLQWWLSSFVTEPDEFGIRKLGQTSTMLADINGMIRWFEGRKDAYCDTCEHCGGPADIVVARLTKRGPQDCVHPEKESDWATKGYGDKQPCPHWEERCQES
jgi:hypothetical protein